MELQPQSSAFEIDLVRKYNQPGPRYTSYPTALHFDAEQPVEPLIDDLSPAGQPVSLYFHLPFCEQLCWFCGCTTVITRDRKRADRYLDHLAREVGLYSEALGPGRPVAQLHFGGGTPNFLEPEQILKLGEVIGRHFELLPDAETSVELAPAHLNREHVDAFRSIGIRRASFGVQDIDPRVQKAVHRIQPQETNLRAIGWLRDAGFESVNIDLIYGLPHQSPESFRKTIDGVLDCDPDRLAIFSYAHVPWVAPAQKILERETLPDAETKLEILEMLTLRLGEAGYQLIGMDHYAKPDDELAVAQRNGTLQRNFQGYSTRGGIDICAFGMSAISQTAGSYRQNHKDLALYEAALERGDFPVERGYLLNRDDLIRRDVIHRLMCDLGLDFARMSAAHEIDFESYFADELASLDDLQEDGLLARGDGRIEVLPLGRLLIRNLAMRFDAYAGAGRKNYSKTI